MRMQRAAHLDLDGAWGDVLGEGRRVDALEWGPRLRYLTHSGEMRSFYDEVGKELPPFLIYGSGDFHHITGCLLRRWDEPMTVVSFDNHPDWDTRPPKWACGAWVSRALELPQVKSVAVWGCGNFELGFPSRLFGNWRGVKSGRLQVFGWAERQSAATQRRFRCVTREEWREEFERFVKTITGGKTYVTVDLDCIREEEAVTNWENGLFTAEDIRWAISQLRSASQIVGGDVCGARSTPVYATRFQRLAGWWDHPRTAARSEPKSKEINRRTLATIWPALVEGGPTI